MTRMTWLSEVMSLINHPPVSPRRFLVASSTFVDPHLTLSRQASQTWSQSSAHHGPLSSGELQWSSS